MAFELKKASWHSVGVLTAGIYPIGTTDGYTILKGTWNITRQVGTRRLIHIPPASGLVQARPSASTYWEYVVLKRV